MSGKAKQETKDVDADEKESPTRTNDGDKEFLLEVRVFSHSARSLFKKLGPIND